MAPPLRPAQMIAVRRSDDARRRCDGCAPQVRPTSVAKVVKTGVVGREWQIYTY